MFCVCVGVLVCDYIVAGAADAALLFYTPHVRLARCQAEIVTASCNCDRHWMAYHNVYGATRLRHHLAVEAYWSTASMYGGSEVARWW